MTNQLITKRNISNKEGEMRIRNVTEIERYLSRFSFQVATEEAIQLIHKIIDMFILALQCVFGLIGLTLGIYYYLFQY